MNVFSKRNFRVFVSILCLCATILNLSPQNITAQQSLDLEIGDYVEFGVYNGEAIRWQVIHKDNGGNPLLFSAEILSYKAFDAKEHDIEKSASDYNEFREASGSNRWAVSNIREWLNSDQLVVNYSTSLPNKDNVSGGHNPYEYEPGFLNGFTNMELLGILPTTLKTTVSFEDVKHKIGGSEVHQFTFGSPGEAMMNYGTSYYELSEDRVFLLSLEEINNYVVGNNLLLQRKPTAGAVENDDSGRFFIDQEASYWLRTPSATSAVASRTMISGGSVNYDNAFYSYVGVVPAFFLDGQIATIVLGDGSLEAPYLLGINGLEAEISDINLESAIRSAIGKPSGAIYIAELKRITHLDASSKQIKDLSGIEVMTNLESLDLSYNNITDFERLNQLTKLESLDLQYNNIDGLDFLVNLMGTTAYIKPLNINMSGNNIDFNNEENVNVINLLSTFNMVVNSYEDGLTDESVEELIGTYLGTLSTGQLVTNEKEALTVALEKKLNEIGTVTYNGVPNNHEVDGLIIEEKSKAVINLKKEINQQLKQNQIFLDRELSTTVIVDLLTTNSQDEMVITLPKHAIEYLLADHLVLQLDGYSLVLERNELLNDFKRVESLTFKIMIESIQKEQSVLLSQLSKEGIKADCGAFAQRIHDVIKDKILENPEHIKIINEIAVQKKVVPTNLIHIGFEKDAQEMQKLYGSFLLRMPIESGKYYSTMFRDGVIPENLGGAYDDENQIYEALIYQAGNYYVGDQMMAINDVVDQNAAYKINYFVSKDILQLNNEMLFMPDSNITRAEAAKAFVQLAHLYNQNANSHFADVSTSHPLYDYIASSADRGIVSGYGDYTFRPDNDIVASEFIKMIGAMLAYKKGYIYPENPHDFVTFHNKDSLSVWLTDYLALCIREGFIDPEGSISFEENLPLTRLEAVHLLYQLSQLL